jgi:hypothetical protein
MGYPTRSNVILEDKLEENILVTLPNLGEFIVVESKFCRITKTNPPKIMIGVKGGLHEFEIHHRGKENLNIKIC